MFAHEPPCSIDTACPSSYTRRGPSNPLVDSEMTQRSTIAPPATALRAPTAPMISGLAEVNVLLPLLARMVR